MLLERGEGHCRWTETDTNMLFTNRNLNDRMNASESDVHRLKSLTPT